MSPSSTIFFSVPGRQQPAADVVVPRRLPEPLQADQRGGIASPVGPAFAGPGIPRALHRSTSWSLPERGSSIIASVSATCSAVKPSSFMTPRSGAEAPKRSSRGPPRSPTQRCQPSETPASTAKRAVTAGAGRRRDSPLAAPRTAPSRASRRAAPGCPSSASVAPRRRRCASSEPVAMQDDVGPIDGRVQHVGAAAQRRRRTRSARGRASARSGA